MDQFMNDPAQLVTQAIDGVLASCDGTLARLDGYPHIKVVHRKDWGKSKVALISGGGSGHEPSHAGFVGKGMLTAAVCGDVFASPSVEAVLAGILAVTGEAGCLLIVKNYTGDRLNFGLAAQRARAFGLQVEMVVVGDDAALPHLPQPRGVAGTLFVHKILGHAAQQGAALAALKAMADRLIPTIASMGMSLHTCSIPGTEREERVAPGNVELGLGIHGEAGIKQVPYTDAAQAMALILQTLQPVMTGEKNAVLLNNLGRTTPLEMSVLMHELAQARTSTRVSHVIGPAGLMTSLDMHGFSVSVLPLNDDWESALMAPVAPAAWPGMAALVSPALTPLPGGLNPIEPIASDNKATRQVIERCCQRLIASKDALNGLDAKSGDGDTGSTLAAAAKALQESLDTMPLADLTQLFPALGAQLSQTMGGSSGVILAIFFEATGEACARGDDPVTALGKGLARISEVGGAQPGDRTLIDALAPALTAFASGGFAAAATAARAGADRTQDMGQAKAGRASYVPEENLLGYNDPGAEAIALLFEELAG
ncbi:MAG: dihydroxyacetone kinase subunit DhaK [Pseudomonadota bacterium]